MDFRQKVQAEMRAAYAAVQGECYTGESRVYPVVFFRLEGQQCYAKIDPQWQHPEHDGIARTITDRCGAVLAQSLTADWHTLRERARSALTRYH